MVTRAAGSPPPPPPPPERPVVPKQPDHDEKVYEPPRRIR